MILVARYIETHATYTHIMLSITITKGVYSIACYFVRQHCMNKMRKSFADDRKMRYLFFVFPVSLFICIFLILDAVVCAVFVCFSFAS